MKNGYVSFLITEQTHRGRDFGVNGHVFTDSKGFVLQSYASPIDDNHNGCYMRGTNFSADNRIVSLSVSKFLGFVNAVKEYNEAMK